MNTDFKFKNKVRLIELFAGIGSQAKALERLGVDFEHYKVVEFDKYAIASYNAIHGTDFVTSDITKIHAVDLDIKDTDKYTYVLTYSFPCQDLSVAGKQKGMVKGSGTRSGLLWEVERLIEECLELPQVLLMENVPQVHSKRNIDDFNQWIRFLESKGYSNYWQDLNAKDYGIPQNRNRTFMVSLLGDYSYNFPDKKKLDIRLNDLLEKDVDNKYYVSEELINIVERVYGDDIRCLQVGDLNIKAMDCVKRVYDPIGISPTLTNMQDGNRQPKIVIKEATKKGYAEAYDGDSINLQYPNSKTRMGRVGKQVSQTLTRTCEMCIVEKVQELSDISYCLDANYYKGTTVDQFIEKHRRQLVVDDLRIRKLTPLECWRLMGFDDSDYYKTSQINSNTQLYKQAGNSIVVDVLEAIFKQMT